MSGERTRARNRTEQNQGPTHPKGGASGGLLGHPSPRLSEGSPRRVDPTRYVCGDPPSRVSPRPPGEPPTTRPTRDPPTRPPDPPHTTPPDTPLEQNRTEQNRPDQNRGTRTQPDPKNTPTRKNRVGLFCWSVLLVCSVGLFCWSVLLVCSSRREPPFMSGSTPRGRECSLVLCSMACTKGASELTRILSGPPRARRDATDYLLEVFFSDESSRCSGVVVVVFSTKTKKKKDKQDTGDRWKWWYLLAPLVHRNTNPRRTGPLSVWHVLCMFSRRLSLSVPPMLYRVPLSGGHGHRLTAALPLGEGTRPCYNPCRRPLLIPSFPLRRETPRVLFLPPQN